MPDTYQRWQDRVVSVVTMSGTLIDGLISHNPRNSGLLPCDDWAGRILGRSWGV